MRQRLIILFLNLFSLIFIKKVDSLASVLISSPFDNFRIECPQTSGAQRLAIRMVESQGQKRQDTVFVLSCQQISDLYPWLEIPEELVDQEHEECHYTQQFDILLDKEMNWTCAGREYIAGIARLSDTRIQLECCKLRTRTEGNCVEYDYDKPAGSGARVEIEYQGKLINALAVYGNLIRVRFCDLSPRPIEDIMAETPQTTIITTTSVIPIAHAVTNNENKFLLRPPTNSIGFKAPTLLNDPRTLAKQRALVTTVFENIQTIPPSIDVELPPANIADGVDELFSMDEERKQKEENKNIQNVQKFEPVSLTQQEVNVIQQNQNKSEQNLQINKTSEQKENSVNIQSMMEMLPINVKKSSSFQPEQTQTFEQNKEISKNTESPRIKVYGHNPFKTIQFGRILQAVGERRKELAVKILRHHNNKLPPENVQSLEYGGQQKHDEQEKHQEEEQTKNEKIKQELLEQNNDEKQEKHEQTQEEKQKNKQQQEQEQKHEEIQQIQVEKHLEENKQKQTLQHLENSIAKVDAAKKQIFEPLKSNLLLRRRGMHEHTFTLTPLQPVDVSIKDDKGRGLEDREKAEMTIQRRIDAIRAAEKRMQIKTIEIPKEENLEDEIKSSNPVTMNKTTEAENVIASKQNDWEPEATTDLYFSTVSTGEAFDGEAMHRILFGEPFQITPKNVLNKIINKNNSSTRIENKQLKIETINLLTQTTTQSPIAAIWWEPMITASRIEEKSQQEIQKPFSGKQINDQLDSITVSSSLDNETTPLLPSHDLVALEVKENALLAPQRTANLPKNKLRIFSLNYGNSGMRKHISELVNEENMETSKIENTTIVQNLDQMNNSINVEMKQSNEATDKKENNSSQFLSIHKSLPIYTLEWEEKEKHLKHKKVKEQQFEQNNKTLSPAEESVETLFPPQIESQNESKFIENTKYNDEKPNKDNFKNKQLQPPTSEEFADVMLKEIDNQDKVPFSLSPQFEETTTLNSQVNFPRQFDDPKTSSNRNNRIIEENNDEKLVDYYYLSRRSPKPDTDINENNESLKNETIGVNNELQGKRKEKKRKLKKKKKTEENLEQLFSLDSFPSPPPLNSRNKIAIIAAASSKQFAQLPPTPIGIQHKQRKTDYKKEIEQRREQINHKTAESVAIELAKASKDATTKEESVNVSENLENRNKKKKHRNREKHLQHEIERQQQHEKHEEREENVQNKHEENQQQKQTKEYRNQQFAALIANSSPHMRMGVDYEVADEDGHINREIQYSTSTRLPKTTRLPLFKRKQLDRIALEVFGPSAFDPSIEHPPIDTALLSRRPLTQKFRHRNPSTPPLETSTGMGMGLPDEETDISPFDAERAQLLERLRYNHKNEENIEETFDDSEATQHELEKHIGEQSRKVKNIIKNTKENKPQTSFDNSFDPSFDYSTTISLPNFENKRQNFGKLNLQKNGHFERVESRFEKASPFDDRHEEEHFEDEEEPHTMAANNAEIRRKPSLVSVPFISPSTHLDQDEISKTNTEAAVKRSISHHFLRKDGNPLFTPKENKPMMKMPSEIIEKINKNDNEQNDINANEAQNLKDVLVPMNEEVKKYESQTTEIPIQTTNINQLNMNSNKNKNKQTTNTESIGNNYWQFFVEPNIYRTTTVPQQLEKQQEEQTVFYNADKYFRLPRREHKNIQRENENVLTFCTKASAIRDSSNLPIACAGEDGQIWQPQRCPPGTGCMPAADSAFYICCPVGIASINRRK